VRWIPAFSEDSSRDKYGNLAAHKLAIAGRGIQLAIILAESRDYS
jgi:hypothetical protein